MPRADTILARVVRKVFTRPPPITAAEWADQFAYFVEDKRPVKYRIANDPYARSILNLVHRPGVREVVIMKAEQLGMTEKLVRLVGYIVDRRPAATLIIYPNANMAGRQNTEKILPAVHATPCLRERLGKSARDAKTMAVNFDRMRITMAAAPPGKKIDANVEAFSYGVVAVDELDRCHPDVIPTVRGRGKTRATFLLWTQSTPTLAGQGVDLLYNGGEGETPSDRGLFHLPCPREECRQYHVREFRHVRWPGVNRKTGQWSDESRDVNAQPERVAVEAWYRCPACGGKVGAEHNLWQAERHVLLTAGQTIGPWSRDGKGEFVAGLVDGPASTSSRAGVHQGGLYTCLPADKNPYGYVAEGFVAARGKPGDIWVQRRLGEAVRIKGHSVEENDLRALCVPLAAGGYRMGTCPAWALILIATVDVQAGRGGYAAVSIYGIGEGGKDRCLVWFGSAPWPENTDGARVDAAVDQAFVRQDGKRLRAVLELVDEGDRNDEVVSRARRRRASGRISHTVKGFGLGGGAEAIGLHSWGWIDKRPDGSPEDRGPRRLKVNVFVWKRAAHRMMRPPGAGGKNDEDELLESLGEGADVAFGAAGRLFLPEDAPDDYLRQMVSEHLAPVRVGGTSRTVHKFVVRQGFTANEAFDCFVYLCAVVDAIPEMRGLRAVDPEPVEAAKPKRSRADADDDEDDGDGGRGGLLDRARSRARDARRGR